MRKILLGLVATLILSAPAFASNSCTAKTPLPITLWNTTSVIPVECTIDTTSTDVTIFDPIDGNMAAIVGMLVVEGTAAFNLTLTDGTDAQSVLEFAQNSGVIKGINGELIFVGQEDNALKVQSSAAVTSLLFYVITADRFIKER